MERIWYGDRFQDRTLRALLIPGSWLYTFGWQTYRWMYRSGLKRAYRPNIPTLCLGNITVGGTGKTPVVAHLLQALVRLGFSPILSCSGYGAPRSTHASLAPSGPLDPGEWGDEPAWFRAEFPDLPIIVGRERVAAAHVAEASVSKLNLARPVLVLDDGLQHLPLAKHISIALIPETRNRHTLPAGPYREPIKNQTLFDLVLPGQFHVEYAEVSFSAEKPGSAYVLCGIANPDRFRATVIESGVKLVGTHYLPDHEVYEVNPVPREWNPEVPILTTEKDWIKIKDKPWQSQYPFITVRRTAQVSPSERFEKWLGEALDAAIAGVQK